MPGHDQEAGVSDRAAIPWQRSRKCWGEVACHPRQCEVTARDAASKSAAAWPIKASRTSHPVISRPLRRIPPCLYFNVTGSAAFAASWSMVKRYVPAGQRPSGDRKYRGPCVM